jgi:hypothetical protein
MMAEQQWGKTCALLVIGYIGYIPTHALELQHHAFATLGLLCAQALHIPQV